LSNKASRRFPPEGGKEKKKKKGGMKREENSRLARFRQPQAFSLPLSLSLSVSQSAYSRIVDIFYNRGNIARPGTLFRYMTKFHRDNEFPGAFSTLCFLPVPLSFALSLSVRFPFLVLQIPQMFARVSTISAVI